MKTEDVNGVYLLREKLSGGKYAYAAFSVNYYVQTMVGDEVQPLGLKFHNASFKSKRLQDIEAACAIYSHNDGYAQLNLYEYLCGVLTNTDIAFAGPDHFVFAAFPPQCKSNEFLAELEIERRTAVTPEEYAHQTREIKWRLIVQDMYKSRLMRRS